MIPHLGTSIECVVTVIWRSRAMTCRDVIEFLMEYRSGTLPAEQRAAFDEHLESCPQCVTYLKSYDEAVRLGKGALGKLDEPVPAEMAAWVVHASLAGGKKRR